MHVILHRALKDAVRWGYVARNVADAADPPMARKPQLQIWTPAELGRFLETVRDDKLYGAWLLAATTGMRRGEVMGLRWSDVDLDRRRLSINHTRVKVNWVVQDSDPKTARGRRSIALDPATVGALRSHRARQAEERLAVGAAYGNRELVFTKPDGSPIHPQLFSRWFAQRGRATGLPPIRLHDLRHSYASAALAAGVPAKVVSERLAHASITVTLDTYSHVLPGLDSEAADTVARLILGHHEEAR